MIKLLISTSNFGAISGKNLKRLKSLGISCSFNPYKKTLTTDQLIHLLKDSRLLIAGTEKITAEVFKKHPQLRFVSRCGIGMDNVDLRAAIKSGVSVASTPEAPTMAVAELTLGLILNLLRNLGSSDREIRAGSWNKHMGNLLTGKTVGIIGFGRIGRKLAELLKPFQVKILVFDVVKSSQSVTLKELFKKSDVVTIHLPFTAKTKHLISVNELKLMKPSAVVINTSRGGIVNEKALFQALKTKRIKGAALDVFEQEPYKGDLRKLDNIILTPHIGSYAAESRVEMEQKALDNVLDFVEAGGLDD